MNKNPFDVIFNMGVIFCLFMVYKYKYIVFVCGHHKDIGEIRQT